MSLITQEAAQAGRTTMELPGLLKQWITVQDEINVLNAEIKQRRKASGVLRDMVLRIMESNDLGQLNISKGAVVRTTRESREFLSTDFLKKKAAEFFEGDEEKAAKLIDYIQEQRGVKTTSTIRLVPGGDTGSQRSK
jgi:hypothetical protein